MEWIQSHLVVFNVASLAVVLLLLSFYIVQVNRSVTAGYQMRTLESEMHALTLEQEKLELAVRQSQSLEEVNRAVKMIGLVPAGRPEYVDGSAPAYAFAQ